MKNINKIKLANVAYQYDTSEKLSLLISNYKKNKRAQNVSFRKLVPWLKVGERATHYIHSYPAKLLPQIAHFFLAANSFFPNDDVVLDPFGGTGTVALESILAGKKAYFSDVNPLAQLIARVKTHPLNEIGVSKSFRKIKERFSDPNFPLLNNPDVVNLSYWYDEKTIFDLNKIRSAIALEKDCDVKNFLLITFSTVCRKVSYADPRLSVPVKLKQQTEPRGLEVWEIFEIQLLSNIKRMSNFKVIKNSSSKAWFVGDDARSLKAPSNNLSVSKPSLESNSVDLILTSPPYAGAQKYIRASSLNLGWLDLVSSENLKKVEHSSIGREHHPKISYLECPLTSIVDADRLIKRVYKLNPLRSKIVAEYLLEMKEAIREMVRVLKPGGYLVLVIGNNQVCGISFKSSEYLTSVCLSFGLNIELKLIDEIKSRGLMTKRNKTASIITREWVLMFQKPFNV